MKELLGSKKFKMAVVGVVVAIAAKIGLNLDTEVVMLIVSPILAFIGAQGVADIGKEKARVESSDKTGLFKHILDGATKGKADGEKNV